MAVARDSIASARGHLDDDRHLIALIRLFWDVTAFAAGAPAHKAKLAKEYATRLRVDIGARPARGREARRMKANLPTTLGAPRQAAI